MVICLIRTLESVELDRGEETQNSTPIILNYYNIWMITISSDHTASNGVTEWGHWLIIYVLSIFTAISDSLIELHHDNPPAFHWADIITIGCISG